jgi:hypothetical protein
MVCGYELPQKKVPRSCISVLRKEMAWQWRAKFGSAFDISSSGILRERGFDKHDY